MSKHKILITTTQHTESSYSTFEFKNTNSCWAKWVKKAKHLILIFEKKKALGNFLNMYLIKYINTFYF